MLLIRRNIQYFSTGTIIGFSFSFFIAVYLHQHNTAFDGLNDSDIKAPSAPLIADVNRIRIHCSILQSAISANAEEQDKHRDQHLTATWLPHCDSYLFVNNLRLPANNNNNASSYHQQLALLIQHLHDSTTELLHKFDWFLIVDDRTFVIIENLRLMLHSSNQGAVYYREEDERELKQKDDVELFGAYVLSRETVKRLGSISNRSTDEYIQFEAKLHDIGALRADAHDAAGMQRMLPTHPSKLFFPTMTKIPEAALTKMPNAALTIQRATNCCSTYPISFHRLSNRDLYMFDYFFYHVS